MATNSRNEKRFDRMLGETLRVHREAVPAGFTERMLNQVQEAEARKVLAQVVLRERLALFGTIALACLGVFGAVFFPSEIVSIVQSIGGSLSGYGGGLAEKVPQAVGVVGSEWQFYAVLGVLLASTMYCLIDLLVGDRYRVL